MVRVGDVRKSHGRDIIVLSVERGRSGEDRTVYAISYLDKHIKGHPIHAHETRGHSIRSCPLQYRAKIRVNKSHGFYLCNEFSKLTEPDS